MKNEEHKVVASLNVYDDTGELDLTWLTEQVGIEPDEAVRKGEKRHPTDEAPLNNSIWSVNSKLPTTADPEEHVVWLLEKLRPHKGNISKIAQKYRVVLAVGATYHGFNPEIILEPEVAKELGELGAQLWLDMYCFTEGEA